MLLATTLAAFALGHGEEGHELVPMGFAPGSTFQPELLVIVTGRGLTQKPGGYRGEMGLVVVGCCVFVFG